MPRPDTIALTGWPFDLESTLNSGQVFHWHPHKNGWAGLLGETPVWIAQPGSEALQCTAGQAAAVRHYLGLDHDMAALTATFPANDPALREAMAWCPGLRILRQPGWECLATFITSSLKQVPHIRKMSLTLRQKFGKPAPAPGLPEQWAYPTPQALAAAGEQALRGCGLGYRAAFLHRTAVEITESRFQPESLSGLNDRDALGALCRLPGVGEKIASCALLFGWQRLAAFPVDVWVERVLRRLYFGDQPDVKPATLREFARTHFGPAGGYAQQFLFHHARVSGILSKK